MIEPRPTDVGRAVRYALPGRSWTPETGFVTGFNAHYVFVRYPRTGTLLAAPRDHLEWTTLEAGEAVDPARAILLWAASSRPGGQKARP